MRQSFALLFLAGNLVFSAATAQTKADFENKISREFCDSFEKAAPRLTKDNMTVEMGVMLLPLMTKYSAEAKQYWGVEMSTKEDLHAFGEKVGQIVSINCPAFLTFIKNNIQDIVTETSESSSAKTVAGKILKIEGQPFAYLLVQNSQGRTDKIYWLEYFEGANNLSTQPAAYLNKAASITYKQMEIYQPLEKEYKTIKVVTRITWKP